MNPICTFTHSLSLLPFFLLSSIHSCFHLFILLLSIHSPIHLLSFHPYFPSFFYTSIISNYSFIHSSFTLPFLDLSILPPIHPSIQTLIFPFIHPPIHLYLHPFTIRYPYILPFNIYRPFLPCSCPFFLPFSFLQYIHPSCLFSSIYPVILSSILPFVHPSFLSINTFIDYIFMNAYLSEILLII